MNIEFKSIEELYDRVIPALDTKRNESLLIYKVDVDIRYIFDYLATTKWKNSSNLDIFEIVNDILNVDIFKVLNYQSLNKGII